MASRVEAAFEGKAVETNGKHIHMETENTIHVGSNGCERKATPGKTAVFAIGRAVPTNTTQNAGLVDRYIAEFGLQDPIVQAKLRRLCKLASPHSRPSMQTTSSSTVMIDILL